MTRTTTTTHHNNSNSNDKDNYKSTPMGSVLRAHDVLDYLVKVLSSVMAKIGV